MISKEKTFKDLSNFILQVYGDDAPTALLNTLDYLNQTPKLDSDIEEELGELQACAEDRYDEIAENLANTIKQAFNNMQKQKEQLRLGFNDMLDTNLELQSKNNELQEEANMYAKQVNELKLKQDKMKKLVVKWHWDDNIFSKEFHKLLKETK